MISNAVRLALVFPALALLALALPARAQDAEIVMITGKGDSRETADAPWRPAAVKQKLTTGSFVRTGEMSQMALLLADRTQVRLNQLSILNIKGVAKPAPPPPTRLDLPQGRAWSQVKPKPGEVAARKGPSLEVSMPAGTAVIRGTDWELVAEKDGTSTVTVLSGEIEFFNEHGRVAVMPNEQARAVPGKAPVKILLSNAAERVQWVTSWRPQPRRWVKDLSGGLDGVVANIESGEFPAALAAIDRLRAAPATAVRASVLLADLQLFQGMTGEVVRTLTPHAADPVAAALLARAHLVAGDFAGARRVLDGAQKHGAHVEVLLARAEYARLQGDEPGARAAYLKVIESDPGNAEGWYGIGRIETDREYVKAAREALERALKIQPDGPGYAGELGSLETFANEFGAADKAFRATLERQPDDYVAQTGLGVLQLKRGETEAALESFLKAGVLEPRYARAWLFSAAAYYQLGETARAVEALKKASTLDDKDPLPHLLESLVHFDSLELGRAIESARSAQARMGNVKSLNQVLTDQRGSANVGSALAAFGMEEWSQAYAYESYSPYWAGSHLFLSDRFSGTFNKNSELFKGFLSDPSVFGASNRRSSIVPVPGHYASVEATASRDYFEQAGLNATLSGYNVAAKPFSYFLSYDKTDGDSEINRTNLDGRFRARGDNAILGLGVKPSHELGIFAFANASAYDAHITERVNGLTNDNLDLDYRRVDVGFNYKFNPTNHAWLKIGDGSEKSSTSGAFFLQRSADRLNSGVLGALFLFSPAGRLNMLHYDQSQRDVQWRHTFDVAPRLQVSWGVEHAEEEKPSILDFQLPVTPLVPSVAGVSAHRQLFVLDNRIRSDTAYVSGRAALMPSVDAQVDLFYQDVKTSFLTNLGIGLVGVLAPAPVPVGAGETRDRELNPRVGIKWRPASGHTLRVAGQMWRKPPGVNTLASVDTMGIAVDDQTVVAGGLLKRFRLQHEMELKTRNFVQWFVDVKEVENPQAGGANIVGDLQLIDLEKLRTRKRVYAVDQEYLEDKPKFGQGRIRQLGLAGNRLVSREITLAGRYVYADTENTGIAFPGRAVPFHPQHYASAALNWQPYARWVIGPLLTYRSSRYQDEANLEPLSAGWSAGFHAYWESADKRWSLAGVIDQLHSDKQSSIYRHSTVQVQGAYRF